MEARWMGFSFWLNIYHSWYLPWRQKQALFLTWKRASEKATGTVLHSSSRRNATRECERKRPSSGLARVTACAKPPKQRRPSASGTSFSDWIGGTCHADTLQVWFPAHWAPVVLQQLQKKEDRHRAENPSWMDEEVAPADIPKQWQEARANRRMQFKVGNYRDGSWESNIRCLQAPLKLTGHSCKLSNTLPRCLRWNKVSLLGSLDRKALPPGGLPTLRSCNSQFFFPTIPTSCLWRTSMQGSMAYQLCRRSPWWSWSSTQGGWLWFSWFEKEVWCQNHVGWSWPTMATITASQWRGDLAGIHLLTSKQGHSQTSPNGREMTWKRPCVRTTTL